MSFNHDKKETTEFVPLWIRNLIKMVKVYTVNLEIGSQCFDVSKHSN